MEEIDAQEGMRRVGALLEMMSEEAGNEFLEMLASALADNGEPAEDAAHRLGRRLGRDDPPPFPSKPETGGGQVPFSNLPESERAEALDRASRRLRTRAHDEAIDAWLRRSGSPRLALDAASLGFADRFPGAKRLGLNGMPPR